MCLIIQQTSWLFWESSIPLEPNWETRRPWRLLSSSCRCCTSCTHQPPRNCLYFFHESRFFARRRSSIFNPWQFSANQVKFWKQEPVACANLTLSASSSSSESPTPPILHYHHLLWLLEGGTVNIILQNRPQNHLASIFVICTCCLRAACTSLNSSSFCFTNSARSPRYDSSWNKSP